MGLRETKIARTRSQIIDVALGLFLSQGYDSTTMEEIAERAEVGTTTLYRYFPSKDLILLDPFTKVDVISNAVRARPADEPIEVALGAAIKNGLEAFVSGEPQVNAVRTIIDGAAGPRARLWDFIAQERDLLEEAIAERIDSDASSTRVKMTARVMLLVIELVADTWRSAEHSRPLVDVADEMLAELGRGGIILPKLVPETQR